MRAHSVARPSGQAVLPNGGGIRSVVGCEDHGYVPVADRIVSPIAYQRVHPQGIEGTQHSPSRRSKRLAPFSSWRQRSIATGYEGAGNTNEVVVHLWADSLQANHRIGPRPLIVHLGIAQADWGFRITAWGCRLARRIWGATGHRRSGARRRASKGTSMTDRYRVDSPSGEPGIRTNSLDSAQRVAARWGTEVQTTGEAPCTTAPGN